MNIQIKSATEDQSNALYSIMALAGEHMHRVLKLSHWHPFVDSERFRERFVGEDKTMYAVYADDVLCGTFNIGDHPEPYYLDDMSDYWTDVSAPALYFSAFALLPSYQQQGIGSQCMAFADETAKAASVNYIRFDGVASHPKLIQFYTRLNYRNCGELPVQHLSVICFEKNIS